MRDVTVLLLVFSISVYCEDIRPTTDFAHVVPEGKGIVFAENFDDDWKARWVISKQQGFEGEWRVEEAQAPYQFVGDKGLVVGSVARKHAISTKFKKVLDNTDKDELVIQYEVKLQKNLDCGGAYLKLISTAPSDLKDFSNDTPYTIMFGPDKCGESDKVHFIIRHQNPISKKYEEKHLTNQPKIKRDSLTHLYTLVIRKDNTFQIEIDREVARTGNLLEDFQPPFTPPKEIDDPTDKKPSDWVDEEKIADPEAKKPDDWDEDAPALIEDPSDVKPGTWLDSEPSEIPDPEAKRPTDWDDDLDGEWEAATPMIPNPKCAEFGCGEWKPKQIKNPQYKGKWSAPLIDNPAYKGEWKAKQIPNPEYVEVKDPHNLEPISGLGFELWTMTDNILFDNILITHSKAEADNYVQQTWAKKHIEEERIKQEETAKNSPGLLDQIRTTVEPLFMQVVEFASNPDNTVVVVIAVLVATILPILLCVLCLGGENKPTEKKQGKPKDGEKKKQE